MKAFYQLSNENLQSIQNETLNYIKNQTDLFDKVDKFWNKINTPEFVKQSPALVNYCRGLNLYIKECAILVVNDNIDVNLHIDELPVTAKINFPILNTKNTFTEWYDIPQSIIDSIPMVENHFGALFNNLGSLELKNFNKIAEIEMLEPLVFNSRIPHRVRIDENAKYPRIVLACTFFNEPIDYLI